MSEFVDAKLNIHKYRAQAVVVFPFCRGNSTYILAFKVYKKFIASPARSNLYLSPLFGSPPDTGIRKISLRKLVILIANRYFATTAGAVL